jgi:hypothetical protein
LSTSAEEPLREEVEAAAEARGEERGGEAAGPREPAREAQEDGAATAGPAAVVGALCVESSSRPSPEGTAVEPRLDCLDIADVGAMEEDDSEVIEEVAPEKWEQERKW